MLKNFLKLMLVLAFCIPFIYGGCNGGGGGGGGDGDGNNVEFSITGHQLYLVDLDCANSCLDFLCIVENCTEPVADDALCVGDSIGFELFTANENTNTTELSYEIHVEGVGVEGPYNFVIEWFAPEQVNDLIIGFYEYALDTAGNHEIHSWLKNATGELSPVYVGDVVVQDCVVPEAALSLSRSASEPISIKEANSEIPIEEQKSIIQRIKSMGYQGHISE
jgi:hypothetical protein